MATTTALAYAGKTDLHPLREPARDSARTQAQEAARQKLIVKQRGDVNQTSPGRATEWASALEAPIFHRYDRP